MDSRGPLVSIVVPSFQQGAYLRECIESIVSQKGVRVEIFVFDSESSDETTAVLRDFKDRAEIFIEKDLGQGHAINKGLALCKGDIVGFLNSDDVLSPRSLQKVVEFWKRNPSTDLLYGKARYINSEGDIVGDYRTQGWDWEKFQGECFICQPAAFWSRRIMEKVGFLDQSLHCSLDYDLWLRIAQAGGRIEHIDEYLACSRDYPETKTRNLRGKVFKENIELSLRRLGYVHASWISQYMDYFKYELRTMWSFMIPHPGKMRNYITRSGQCLSRAWAKDMYVSNKPYRRVI